MNMRQKAFNTIEENIRFCITNDLPQMDIFIKDYLYKIFFDVIYCWMSEDEAFDYFKKVISVYKNELSKK